MEKCCMDKFSLDKCSLDNSQEWFHKLEISFTVLSLGGGGWGGWEWGVKIEIYA